MSFECLWLLAFGFYIIANGKLAVLLTRFNPEGV